MGSKRSLLYGAVIFAAIILILVPFGDNKAGKNDGSIKSTVNGSGIGLSSRP